VEGGYAVSGGFFAPVNIVNSGTITGNIDGATSSAPPSAVAGGSTVDNLAGGMLAPYDTIDLGPSGRLSNAGVVEVSGIRRRGGTTLTGDLVQSGTGRLRVDLDSAAGKADHLHVTGAATLAGGFEVVPTMLRPGSHEILSADGGVALDEGFAGVGTHLFTHKHSLRDGRLSFSPTADFSADGSDTEDRNEVADHLQRIWDAGGDGFATGFAALASVADGDAEAYAAAVDSLSTQSVAAVGYARYLGSQAFAQATYSCPRFEDASVFRTQASCGWLRARGSWLDRDASDDDPGFDFEALTTALGGQAEIADDLFLGGAVGWEAGRLRQDDSGTRVKGDAYLGVLSLKRELGAWTLTGAADLGWGDHDSDREIVVGTTRETASGSPDAFNAGLHARAAYQIPRGTWYAEPALDLDLVYVWLDGYTESSAGDFDLEVASTDTVVATGTPWLKLGRRIDFTPGVTLDAFVAAGVSLSTGDDFDADARFADAPSGAGDFTTRLDNPSVVGRLSAGVDLYATDRVHVRLQYDGSFADDRTANGGQVPLSYFF
jgi:outer membrane autotransporter protein